MATTNGGIPANVRRYSSIIRNLRDPIHVFLGRPGSLFQLVPGFRPGEMFVCSHKAATAASNRWTVGEEIKSEITNIQFSSTDWNRPAAKRCHCVPNHGKERADWSENTDAASCQTHQSQRRELIHPANRSHREARYTGIVNIAVLRGITPYARQLVVTAQHSIFLWNWRYR